MLGLVSLQYHTLACFSERTREGVFVGRVSKETEEEGTLLGTQRKSLAVCKPGIGPSSLLMSLPVPPGHVPPGGGGGLTTQGKVLQVSWTPVLTA